MKKPKLRITVEQFLDAIEGSGGSTIVIAKRLGVSEEIICRRLKMNKDLEIARMLEGVKAGDVEDCLKVLRMWGHRIGWDEDAGRPINGYH